MKWYQDDKLVMNTETLIELMKETDFVEIGKVFIDTWGIKIGPSFPINIRPKGEGNESYIISTKELVELLRRYCQIVQQEEE